MLVTCRVYIGLLPISPAHSPAGLAGCSCIQPHVKAQSTEEAGQLAIGKLQSTSGRRGDVVFACGRPCERNRNALKTRLVAWGSLRRSHTSTPTHRKIVHVRKRENVFSYRKKSCENLLAAEEAAVGRRRCTYEAQTRRNHRREQSGCYSNTNRRLDSSWKLISSLRYFGTSHLKSQRLACYLFG